MVWCVWDRLTTFLWMQKKWNNYESFKNRSSSRFAPSHISNATLVKYTTFVRSDRFFKFMLTKIRSITFLYIFVHLLQFLDRFGHKSVILRNNTYIWVVILVIHKFVHSLTSVGFGCRSFASEFVFFFVLLMILQFIAIVAVIVWF